MYSNEDESLRDNITKNPCIIFIFNNKEFQDLEFNLESYITFVVLQKHNYQSVTQSNDTLSLYQGEHIKVGVLIDQNKQEYNLYDIIFDIPNEEKQSVLTNFAWEGQYQSMDANNNKYWKSFNILQDTGSHITELDVKYFESLKVKLYLFDFSLTIKPQYWNTPLNIFIQVEYTHFNTDEFILNNNIIENFESFVLPFSDNEFNEENLYTCGISLPVIIKVPLTISNYYFHNEEFILYMDILNHDPNNNIIIEYIYSNFPQNGELNLPWILKPNQYWGCTLKINDKRILNKNGDSATISQVIPIFIKWKVSLETYDHRVLTQFALQLKEDSIENNDICYIGELINRSNFNSNDTVKTGVSSNLDHGSDKLSLFSATCSVEGIAEKVGDIIYLNIEVINKKPSAQLNLQIVVDYHPQYPVVPIFEKMSLNYNSYTKQTCDVLYPLTICYPGIFKCPNIYITDQITNFKYSINKLPILICKS
ncbi:hypothetical protein ACR3K2_36100 [Cryptosporidium serpentis]